MLELENSPFLTKKIRFLREFQRLCIWETVTIFILLHIMIKWVPAKADLGRGVWAVGMYSADEGVEKCCGRREAFERRRFEEAQRSPVEKAGSPATWLKITEYFWTLRTHFAWTPEERRPMIFAWLTPQWFFCLALELEDCHLHCHCCWSTWWYELTWTLSTYPSGLSYFFDKLADWAGFSH